MGHRRPLTNVDKSFTIVLLPWGENVLVQGLFISIVPPLIEPHLREIWGHLNFSGPSLSLATSEQRDSLWSGLIRKVASPEGHI